MILACDCHPRLSMTRKEALQLIEKLSQSLLTSMNTPTKIGINTLPIMVDSNGERFLTGELVLEVNEN